MPETQMELARAKLADVWGYNSFRPLQERSIECVLKKVDSLTVLPTGGGKSLCFQVPALCQDGTCVVVSPLISLMKDQVDALDSLGVPAAFVNSSQSDDERRAVADRLRKGEIKLLYVAPERLLTDRMLEFLRAVRVSYFAIDEAHCISNWGHDFRPEYRGLKILKDQFPGTSLHAFTATASEAVRLDIVNQLGMRQPEILVGDFDRPNLVFRMLRANQRQSQIVEALEKHRGQSCIVYCISRKEVEKTAIHLRELGFSARPYHAGMDDEKRKINQDAFSREKCDVIVATVAFGMGIDKSNVRCVVHAGMPKSIEHYQQESGRAGRDGLESECVLLYSGADMTIWRKIISQESSSNYDTALKSLNAMYELCSQPVCRHRALVEYFGQPYLKPNCGACDVCLDEVELIDDPLTVSQKILSCVIRLEERFGASYVAKVLAGSNDLRIRESRHDQLSTYGLLRDEGADAVRTWTEQLISQGFLQRIGDYQVIALTETGRRLLRREGTPKLTVVNSTKQKASASRRSKDSLALSESEEAIFQRLRQLRARLATERNVPPFVVFGDEQLRDFAIYRPVTIEQFARIKGVGEKKKATWGAIFVELLQELCAEFSLESTLSEPPATVADEEETQVPQKSAALVAFEYFRKRETIESVAAKLSRANSTVAGYLSEFIKHDKIIDPSPWVSPDVHARIRASLHLVEGQRLKPLFEHFQGDIPYDALRISLSCLRNEYEAANV